jgi:pimeloyl-ACP methyl ester carboxylesterase
MDDFAADVVAFLDALDLPSATVVGHSMGSFVAQQVALTAPDRVSRLVLVGSAASPRNPGTLELAQAINELDDPVPAEFAREFQNSTIYQPIPDDFLNRVVAESLKLPAQVWRTVLAGLMAIHGNRLDQIQAQTLVLWGDQDTVFSRADQDTLMAGLRNAILKVYPETGHALHWERPAQFVRDLEDFI